MGHEKRIEKQADESEGRYAGRIDGVEGEAELTFTIRGPAVISADHTGVPDSMRGTGMGLALVEAMIADAREFRVQDHPALSLRGGPVQEAS